MRFSVAFLVLAFCSSAIARTPLWRKVEALEKRVAALEAKLASKSSVNSSGLKVRDLNNQQIGAGSARGVSSTGGPQLTPEQQAEIQKQLELYKQKQQESQKLLDEIMNEDY